QRRLAGIEVLDLSRVRDGSGLGPEHLVDRPPTIFSLQAIVAELPGLDISGTVTNDVGAFVNEGPHRHPAGAVVVAERRHRLRTGRRPDAALVVNRRIRTKQIRFVDAGDAKDTAADRSASDRD